jgi:hypothetical protein
MESARFDTLVRSLTDTRSHRGAVTTVLGSTLGLLSLTETIAKKKKGKKGKKDKPPSTQTPSAPPPAPLVTRPDVACTTTAGLAVTLGLPDQRLAQTFTPRTSGLLVAIAVNILRGATRTEAYWMDLVLVDDLGIPVNTFLAQASVRYDSFPSGIYTLVTFTFEAPVSVTAGTTYAFIISRPGTDDLDLLLYTGDPALCPGQYFFSPTLEGSFTDGTTTEPDIAYTTFVAS